MVAVQVVASNRPFATSRSCGRTSAFRQAPLAAVKAMSAAPTTTDTTMSWVTLSQPSANAAGTLINAANRTRSIATMTGRLRRNSTQGPSGSATTAPTASPAAASRDTSVVPACRTRIAIKGNASNASHVPSVLIAYAVQSHPNCRPSDRLATMISAPSSVRHAPAACRAYAGQSAVTVVDALLPADSAV